MAKGKVSKRLLDMLSEVLMSDLDSKVLDGITYVMVDNSEKDKKKYNKFMEVRKEADKCGFGPDEVFRVYKLKDGYIFDMDLTIAKKITFEISKAVEVSTNGALPSGDYISDKPEKRRKADMVALAKHCIKEARDGKDIIEVALFSRNSTPNIILTGTAPVDGNKKEDFAVKYKAYAIRHWDIAQINQEMLIPQGLVIETIEPCEVLPSETGVRFRLHVRKLEKSEYKLVK